MKATPTLIYLVSVYLVTLSNATPQAPYIPADKKLASSTPELATSSQQASTGSALLSSSSSSHLSGITTLVASPATSHTSSSALSVSPSSLSATSSSTSAQPTQSVGSSTREDLGTITVRRLSNIIGALTGASSIATWLSTLGSNGKWPDSEINYTSGCDAIRANWPAQAHWSRITTMAGAWHGGLSGGNKYVKSAPLRSNISLAMEYWFSNDLPSNDCLEDGGTASCPCGTPGFWNTNWFSNIILIPRFVSQTCLLLNDTLTPTELGNCTKITGRAYGKIDHYTGANTLDISTIGIDEALLTLNVSLITDAYANVHAEVQIKNTLFADGIRADGSFGQHMGVLYNGNYGKDYANDVLNLEIEAGGTQFEAGTDSKNAMATLIDGDQWMIFYNVITGVLHWDFSVLGRFISFPVADNQATGSIKINLTQVEQLGEAWDSQTLLDVYDGLKTNTTNANAGNVRGNRMFYDSDYMVHRGAAYVTTLKMYSTRTRNTECLNSQNPPGFHLSDGTVYTYMKGNEYEDISAAWDWNLIPGTTVDYGATVLNCATANNIGAEAFVGGVSDGQVGLAVMRYTNPLTHALHWQKAWFFLDDDVQHVMISNISSASNSSIYSVLDQRIHTGDIYINGHPQTASNSTHASSLWHDNVGYTFDHASSAAVGLSVQVGNKTGDWSTIGTSTKPPITVDLFAAWLEHKSLTASISYSAFPSISYHDFTQKCASSSILTLRNDAHVSALYDDKHHTAMMVFWDPNGGAITFTPSIWSTPVTISANGGATIIYRLKKGEIIVSDPSQTLPSLDIGVNCHGKGGVNVKISVTLPQGGLAGSSVSKKIAI